MYFTSSISIADRKYISVFTIRHTKGFAFCDSFADAVCKIIPFTGMAYDLWFMAWVYDTFSYFPSKTLRERAQLTLQRNKFFKRRVNLQSFRRCHNSIMTRSGFRRHISRVSFDSVSVCLRG